MLRTLLHSLVLLALVPVLAACEIIISGIDFPYPPGFSLYNASYHSSYQADADATAMSSSWSATTALPCSPTTSTTRGRSSAGPRSSKASEWPDSWRGYLLRRRPAGQLRPQQRRCDLRNPGRGGPAGRRPPRHHGPTPADGDRPHPALSQGERLQRSVRALLTADSGTGELQQLRARGRLGP